MAKYILKPIVFEAVKWTPTTRHDKITLHAMHRVAGGELCKRCGQLDRLHGFIDRGDDLRPDRVCPGDYVVTHPTSGTYTCAPKDFEDSAVEVTKASAGSAAINKEN